jgi:cytochrome c oxidase assembly protein subunit 19
MLYLVLYLIKYTTTYIDLVRREEKQVLMMITIKFDLNRYSCSWGAGGAFGGNRGLRPIPPEKGIFPLDHLHECDAEKKEYLGCLKSSAHKSEQCRHLSKKYLQCRMAKNLMAKQDMAELGFSGVKELDSTEDKNTESIEH